MAQTTIKLGDRYISTIKSQGRTIAKTIGNDRQQVRRSCLAEYQLKQGVRVL